MRLRFVVGLARREARSALGRIGVFLASIALGVGALVAIHGFREDMAASLRAEAEALLGADVRLSSGEPFPESVLGVRDSLSLAGRRTATVTTVLSMVEAPRTGSVRLLQVRGIEGGFPFYGEMRTEPPGGRALLADPAAALADPAALSQLGIGVGDSVLIGEARYRVVGTVDALPTDLGFRTAAGPRLHLSQAALGRAGLVEFGSLARWELFIEMPDADERRTFRANVDGVLSEAEVRYSTADGQVADLTDAVEWLGRYLGLVGLAALLLGAVGVASAVHVFVQGRLTTVAVLRCLGARQREVMTTYVLLTAALGLAGSVAGALLGLAAQALAGDALGPLLGVDVQLRLRPGVALAGVATGLWVSLLFALAPLLALRRVPPLAALRRDFEPPRDRFDPARWILLAALAATVALLAARQAPEADQGLAFAAGVVGVAALLWATAWVLMRVARRLFPSRAPYPVRQGVANLFRPRNQTVPVTLALGFGAFVIGTLLQVQASLADALSLERGETPNLVLFDVQPDQTAGVVALFPGTAAERAEVTPMVTARIGRLGRRSVSAGGRADRWALRREYRNTWRDTLTATETLVEGRWFDALAPRGPDEPARVSVEADLARSLAVGVGDTIVWDIGGVDVASVIASLRTVDWGQFATNFFVVFEPGVLEAAPRMDVVLANVPDRAARAEVQRRLVREYPNVSALDVEQVQAALERVLGKVSEGVRFLALACALAGALVLGGALSTSRHQRSREAALLRTLGARRGQVEGVLLTEYAALGTVAALAGLLLAAGASRWIVRSVLELPFTPALGGVAAVWLGVTALTVAMGRVASAPALRRPPLAVLREISE